MPIYENNKISLDIITLKFFSSICVFFSILDFWTIPLLWVLVLQAESAHSHGMSLKLDSLIGHS